MLGFERNLHGLSRDGELELFFAGEPSYRGEQKIVRHAQVFFDRRERGLTLVGQVEPNRAGGFSDLMIAECGSSGRGFNVGRSFGRRLGICLFGGGGFRGLSRGFRFSGSRDGRFLFGHGAL